MSWMNLLMGRTSGGGGGGTDPNFAAVSLLLHCDGANGATTYTDSSANALTNGGAVAQTTAQQKYGSASADLHSAGSTANISYTDSALWQIGANQFTWECYVRFTANAGTAAFISQLGSSFFGPWFGMLDTTDICLLYSTTGSDLVTISAPWTPTLNTWYHVAVDRDASNVVRLYVDGVVKGTPTTAAVTFFRPSNVFAIGNDSRGVRKFDGLIDEVRITKGVARYGGAFTPPIAAFPNS